MIEWIARELVALAEALLLGALWCLIFWGGTEFFGARPPHWTTSIYWVFLAGVFAALALLVKWISNRRSARHASF
jgi:preprotein translocase subunit SecG